MTNAELIVLARSTAIAHGLDPVLVCAVCQHESAGWKQWAVRFEPTFLDRWVPKDLPPTERMGRAFSYGLMQIMGQTAREFGFKGEFCAELLDPYAGLEFGCRKLADCMKKESGDVRKALLRYNGGGDSHYPDLVLRYVVDYQ